MILVPIIKELFDLIVSKDVGYKATILTLKEEEGFTKSRRNLSVKTYRYFLLDDIYPVIIQIENNEKEGVVFTPNDLPEETLKSLVSSLESRSANDFLEIGNWKLEKIRELDSENDYLRNNYTAYQSYDCDNRLEEGVYELSYPKYCFTKKLSIKKIDLYGDPENMIAYENKFNAYPEREYNRSLCKDYISLITFWANKNYGAS